MKGEGQRGEFRTKVGLSEWALEFSLLGEMVWGALLLTAQHLLPLLRTKSRIPFGTLLLPHPQGV